MMEKPSNGSLSGNAVTDEVYNQIGTVASVSLHSVTIKFTLKDKEGTAIFMPSKMHLNGRTPLLAVCKTEAELKEFLQEGDTVCFDTDSSPPQKSAKPRFFITLVWKGTKPDEPVLKCQSSIRDADACVNRKVQILDVLAKKHRLLREDIRACQCHHGDVTRILSSTHGVMEVKGKEFLFNANDVVVDGWSLRELDHTLGHYVKVGDKLSCYARSETIDHGGKQYSGMALSAWVDTKRNDSECWFLVLSRVHFMKVLPSPDAASHRSKMGYIKEIHLAKGGIIDTGYGKEGLIYFHYSRVFINRKKMRLCESIEEILKVGDRVMCDIMKNETEDGTPYIANYIPWIALLVWTGDKPDIHPSLFKKLPAADVYKGRVLKLDLPGETGVESGIMLIENNSAPCRKVTFHRSMTYLFGLRLVNADLAHLLREGDRTYCIFEQGPQSNKSSPPCEVALVWIGYKSGPTIEDFFTETHLMTKYLSKLTLDFELLDKLVAGELPPKKYMPIPGVRMPEGVVFARVIHINPPTGDTGVATAVLLLESGIGAGHQASLHRNNLSIWGFNMTSADLSYIFNKDDELFCEIEPSLETPGLKFKVARAWVGSWNRIEDGSSKLSAWLMEHNLEKDTFDKLVQGRMAPRMYLPFPGEVMVAKVVTLDPPKDSTGVQSGLLQIEKGSLEGQQARFSRQSFFVFGYRMDKADLRYILDQNTFPQHMTERRSMDDISPGADYPYSKARAVVEQKDQKVMCEVEEVPLEEREKLKQETGYDAEYQAVLTWTASGRPRNDRDNQLNKDQNMAGWLKKRGLSVQKFQSLVSGELPALAQNKVPSQNNEPSKPLVAEGTTTTTAAAAASTSGPLPLMDMTVAPPPPSVSMNPLMRYRGMAGTLFETLMHIDDPADPLVDSIIENEDQAKIALFVSRTLTQALMSYRRKTPLTAPLKRSYPSDRTWGGGSYSSGGDYPFKRHGGLSSWGRGGQKFY